MSTTDKATSVRAPENHRYLETMSFNSTTLVLFVILSRQTLLSSQEFEANTIISFSDISEFGVLLLSPVVIVV